MFLIWAVIVILLFYDSGDFKQATVMPRVYHIFMSFMIPPMCAVLVVLVGNVEMKLALRELKEGRYSVQSYLVSASSVSALFVSVLALIPFVAISNFLWQVATHFPLMLLVSIAMMLSFENMALVRATETSSIGGAANFVNDYLMWLLVSGVIVPYQSLLIVPFRFPLASLSPYRWTLALLIYETYIDCPIHTDAVKCQDCETGFTCPNRTNTPCYGIEGDQVLEGLSYFYDIFGPQSQFITGIAALYGVALLFKTVELITWRQKAVETLKLRNLN